MFTTENWAPVPGFDYYEVSDRGAVRSYRGWGGKRLAEPKPIGQGVNRDGYPIVGLTTSGKVVQWRVNRLVALTFLGPCPDGYVVAHGNGNRSDNHISNLRYATPAENEADKATHGTKLLRSKHPNAILSDADVEAIRSEYARGATQVMLAEKYGTHQTNVSLIVRNKAWKAAS